MIVTTHISMYEHIELYLTITSHVDYNSRGLSLSPTEPPQDAMRLPESPTSRPHARLACGHGCFNDKCYLLRYATQYTRVLGESKFPFRDSKFSRSRPIVWSTISILASQEFRTHHSCPRHVNIPIHKKLTLKSTAQQCAFVARYSPQPLSAAASPQARPSIRHPCGQAHQYRARHRRYAPRRRVVR